MQQKRQMSAKRTTKTTATTTLTTEKQASVTSQIGRLLIPLLQQHVFSFCSFYTHTMTLQIPFT